MAPSQEHQLVVEQEGGLALEIIRLAPSYKWSKTSLYEPPAKRVPGASATWGAARRWLPAINPFLSSYHSSLSCCSGGVQAHYNPLPKTLTKKPNQPYLPLVLVPFRYSDTLHHAIFLTSAMTSLIWHSPFYEVCPRITRTVVITATNQAWLGPFLLNS